MSLPLSASQFCRRCIASAVISGISLFVCVNSGKADITVSVSNLISDIEGEDYRAYGYLAQQIVSSGNSIAAGVGRWGHDKLNLAERSPVVRWAYMATVLQLQIRVQWANSLYFGHEFLHFATAHQYGRDDHFFRDSKNGEKIDLGDAYLSIIKDGDVGGPAVSIGKLSGSQQKNHNHQGITSTTAGVNWQMNYSERWVRYNYAFGNKDFFDAPGFFLNRTYLAAYAFGDKRRRSKGDMTGDIQKWARHLEKINPAETDVLDRVTTYSLIANIVSPTYWSSVNSFGKYIYSGNTAFNDPILDKEAGGLTWDVPQYLNLSSMTVAPTLYWSMGRDTAKELGAENLLIGASVEVPVVGTDESEYRVSVTGKWQKFDTDFSITKSRSGHFAEIESAYSLNSNIALTAGAAVAGGKTLRGDRNFPHGKAAGWFGVRISF